MANKPSKKKATFEAFKEDFENQPEIQEERDKAKKEGRALRFVTPTTVLQDDKNKTGNRRKR